MPLEQIVLFDGLCNLCNHAVDFIIRRDKAGTFKFASLQSEEGITLCKRHNLDPTSTTGALSTLILVRDQKAWTRSSAVLRIAKKLDGIWPLFSIFLIIPYPIRDFVYNLVSQNRYRMFGKRNTCRIPSTEEKARFL